ncbi:hypothetical protein MBOVJF4428_00007 [Mycoplasmopsis agalactiae]|uniref:lipoprotein, MAG6090 family n=1 Tax=Mycoplasmopsis agalactiae TaxID=2110 RepID=UPI000CA159FF|nr:hypothetical protein [Mycoplasmopsis agalactiae]MCE6057333.1 hypothetical protein [Mycoplasmopsis agalactiae]MCE6079116.1 hypothetical protein [Mycoplasmopsis agalactiae]MCE6095504.1 hypothetical protein [Mycoplasmopsis agalactiae]MCE6114759.1 hypothetical protein [Mycoplasmopsis agalactiae]NLS34209.1 hypothetical protein [Mycoplasmopsis agalactiae]
MKKTLLAKNVLLLISMPLISSACYAPNILENNANKPVWKDFSNKNHNDVYCPSEIKFLSIAQPGMILAKSS